MFMPYSPLSSAGSARQSYDLLSTFAYRGLAQSNLGQNKALAESRLQAHIQAAGAPNVPAKAQALLECGIAYLLRGETLLAFRYFKDAAGANGSDGALYLHALCYGLHCLYLTYQWAAGSLTVPADEMDPLYNLSEALPFWGSRIADVEKSTGWLPVCQARLLLEQHRAAAAQTPRSPQQLCALEQAIQRVSSAQLPFPATAPLLLELAGLHRRASSSSSYAEAVILGLQGRYAEAGDEVGMAHCEVALGDLACAPAGPPEYWGQAPRPGLESTTSSQPAGWPEPPVATPQIEDALGRYRTARSLFTQADFRRGLGTVAMRLGYAAVLQARLRPDDSARCFQAALRDCTEAQRHFADSGDAVAHQTARVHMMLCRVALGQRPEDRASAREIGSWGRTVGSISYTLGLGLFLAAQARRWITDDADYERGLAAFRLAEALLDGLGLARYYTAAVADQMSVYEMLGEHDRFAITAERALKTYRALYEEPGTSALASWARPRAAHVLQRMLRQAMERQDPQQIAAIIPRLSSMYPLPPEHPATSEPSAGMAQTAVVGALTELIRTMDVATEHSGPLQNADSMDAAMAQLQTAESRWSTQHLIRAAEFQQLMFLALRARRNGDASAAGRLWDAAEDKAWKIDDRCTAMLWLARVAAARDQHDISAFRLGTYWKLKAGAVEWEAERSRSGGSAQDVQQILNLEIAEVHKTSLSGFARINKFGLAKEMLDRLVALLGEDWWKQGDALANLTTTAVVYEGLGRFALAWWFYEEAMRMFDDRRSRPSLDEHKLSLAGSSQTQGLHFKAARAAVKWHRSLDRTDTGPADSPQLSNAFKALERGKARSLLDLMAASSSSLIHISLPLSERAVWDEYRRTSASLAAKRGLLRQQYAGDEPDKARIARWEGDISDGEATLAQLEGRLFAEKSPAARRFVTTTDVSDIDSIRPRLDAETAVLQYSYRGGDVIAWAITKDGMAEVHHLSACETELELRVKRFREQCQSPAQNYAAPSEAPDAAGADGEWLAGLLFPFDAAIMDKFHLIVVAYQALHALPFHALPHQGGPLLAAHLVTYLPSASCIGYLEPHNACGSGFKVLAVGNPSNMAYEHAVSGERCSLKALRCAEAEARMVGQVNAASKSLVGHEATKEAVASAMGDFDALHFATHGLPCPEVPMLSSIALADGERLTVGEFLVRRLRASLVVLSACDTGIGQPTDGDDVVGFSRSLLAAGVQAIVVSLWPVDDLVTSLIMREFYQRLQTGKGASEALRESQLMARQLKAGELDRYAWDIQKGLRPDEAGQRPIAPQRRQGKSRDYSEPRFWAPFIYIGV